MSKKSGGLGVTAGVLLATLIGVAPGAGAVPVDRPVASAMASSSSLSLSARIGVGPVAKHPGGRVTVTGQGWGASSTVRVTLGSAAVAARTDRVGRFSVRVLVPWRTVPGMVMLRAVQGATSATSRVRVGVNWRMAGLDKARSFVNPYEKQLTKATVSDLEVTGRYVVGGAEADNAFAWFATLGDSAYACTLAGNIAQFDLPTRAVRWQFIQDNPQGHQLCSGDGGPYLDDNGTVWVGQLRFDAETGRMTYGGRADITIPYGNILIAGGTSYVNNRPTAMDPKTGDTLWRAEGTSAMVFNSNGVLYSNDTGSVYETEPDTGRTLWSREFTGVNSFDSNGKVLVSNVGTEDGQGQELARLDPDSGERMWAIPNGSYSPVTIDTDRLYVVRPGKSFADRILTGIDLNGQQAWATPLPKDWLNDARITQANGVLYVPMWGMLATYDAATGKQLSTISLRDPSGQKVVPGTAIVDDGHVYLTSTTGVYDLTIG